VRWFEARRGGGDITKLKHGRKAQGWAPYIGSGRRVEAAGSIDGGGL
jgi:hypothetical protein